MLQQLLDVKTDRPAMISFVGAGGKTTAIMTLSREMSHLRRLITTTTAFFIPDSTLWDELVVAPELQPSGTYALDAGKAIVWGGFLGQDNKLLGVPLEALQQVYTSRRFDVILVEADGSKRRPIKAPMDHEPVIPETTTMVIGVIGLSALNKPVNQRWVHRVESFRAITDTQSDELIRPEHVVTLVMATNGLFKGTPSQAVKVLLLNQADTVQDIHLGKRVIQLLNKRNAGIEKCILTSFDSKTCTLVWGERH